MFDNHVHSVFSTDSKMPAETACESAISEGLEGIVFTDHFDFDYPGEEFLVDFDKYMEFMAELKKKYKDRLKILRGIEVGIQPHVIEETDKVVKAYPFDYVIGSVHVIDRQDPYKGVYYKDKSSKEAYGGYLLEILRMVEDFKDFDNVGHFEYITRYAGYDDRMLRYREHSEVFDEIFRKLIYSGRGFELNTASFRDKTGIKTIDFDTDILIRYRELGGEIISLGSDAHQPEYLGYKFGYFSELLKQKGYRYVARYESRKPVFEKL